MTRYHQRYLISMLMTSLLILILIYLILGYILTVYVCSLLYAEDLVVFADSEVMLQCLLDTVYN